MCVCAHVFICNISWSDTLKNILHSLIHVNKNRRYIVLLSCLQITNKIKWLKLRLLFQSSESRNWKQNFSKSKMPWKYHEFAREGWFVQVCIEINELENVKYWSSWYIKKHNHFFTINLSVRSLNFIIPYLQNILYVGRNYNYLLLVIKEKPFSIRILYSSRI